MSGTGGSVADLPHGCGAIVLWSIRTTEDATGYGAADRMVELAGREI